VEIELGKASPSSWRGRLPLAVGASSPGDVFSGGGEDHLASRGFCSELQRPLARAGRTTWLPARTGFGRSGGERPMAVMRPWHKILQAGGRERGESGEIGFWG
jgi:hypothetical protein